MRSGVTLLDPAQYLCGRRCGTIGRDTVIYPGCVLQRGTTGRRSAACSIPAAAWLRTAVGDDAVVEQAVAEDSAIAPGTRVGSVMSICKQSIAESKQISRVWQDDRRHEDRKKLTARGGG